MLRRFIAFFRPQAEPLQLDWIDVCIAKRALRMANRDAAQAAKFERVHSILKAGRK